MTNPISTTPYPAHDNALQALLRQPVSRVPVGISLGGSWPVHQQQRTLHDIIGEAEETARIYHEVHTQLDADIIMPGAGATALIARALGSEVVFDRKGAPQIVTGVLEAQSDLDALDPRKVWEDDAVQYLFESVRLLAGQNRGTRLILPSGRAPFTIVGQLLGLERLSRALYRDPLFVHEALARVSEIVLGYFLRMLAIDGVDGIFIADPSASGDVISPRHFNDFAAPSLQQVITVIRQSGKVSLLHICGDITDRLTQLPDIGIDGISLDAKVDLRRAVALVGSRLCIAGNVDPVSILEFGTPAQVGDAVHRCLQAVSDAEGFILLPGCDLAYGVPWENVAAFIQAAHTVPIPRLSKERKS